MNPNEQNLELNVQLKLLRLVLLPVIVPQLFFFDGTQSILLLLNIENVWKL